MSDKKPKDLFGKWSYKLEIEDHYKKNIEVKIFK